MRQRSRILIGLSLFTFAVLSNPIILGKLVTRDGVIMFVAVRILLWIISSLTAAIFFFYARNPERTIRYFIDNQTNIILLIIVVSISLLFVEAVLRITSGWLVKSDIIYTEGYEFSYTFRKNAHGFRDDTFIKTKDPGRFRIFLIGDSFVEGFVRSEYVLDVLLEKECGAAGIDCEAFNLGVSGYGANEYTKTAYEFIGYAPDVVILFFYIDNDVEEAVAPDLKWVPTMRDHLIAAVNSLYIVKTAEKVMSRMNKAWVYPWLKEYQGDAFYRNLLFNEEISPHLYAWARMVSDFGGVQGYYDDMLEIFNRNPATKTCIRAIQGMYPDAHFLLVLCPSKYQIGQKYLDRLKEIHFILFEDTVADRKLQDALISWSRASGVEYLDLLPVMQENADRELFYDIDPHCTEEGYVVIAGAIYRKLEEMGVFAHD
jgi:hypothetical protein